MVVQSTSIKSWLLYSGLTIGVVALLSPLILYSYVFGVGIWSEHSEWAAMGSAIGGLYTPILTVVTSLILAKQFQLQREMSRYQIREESRKKVFDTVETYSQKLKSQTSEKDIDNIKLFCSQEPGSQEAEDTYKSLRDIMVIWTVIVMSMRRYKRNEPSMVYELSAIPVIHLTFARCCSLEKIYNMKNPDNNFHIYQKNSV